MQKGEKYFLVLICLGLIGWLQVQPGIGAAEERRPMARVAILPFENMSGQFLAIDEVMKPFYEKLDHIFILPSSEEVDDVILRLRLRHTGFLSSQDTSEIGLKLGVRAIILGMICVYQETPIPRIGLIIKMIGTGEGTPILWMKSAISSGNQWETWFGRNRISKVEYLVSRMIDDLIKEIPIDLSRKDIES